MSRPRRFLSSVLGSVVALFVAAAGCSLITKTDRSKIPSESGGGGAGGTSTTTSPGGGGAGATGGTGGSTCTVECCSPHDCPEPDNECVSRVCEDGKCGTVAVTAGVPVSTQTTGDCKRIVCDGSGATKAELDAADIPEDGNECTVDKCVGGQPKNTFAPAGQTCNQEGGKKCDGSGACLQCLTPNDCPEKVCTLAGACAPAMCGDEVKNGDETDVDCGGACGATCKTGDDCAVAGDCIDKVCSGPEGGPTTCAAPKCDDTLQNGDETDVDCGGSCAKKCAPHAGCKKDIDCKGGLCTGSTCAESCTDGVLNNAEKALDCGGPICAATCAVGTPCDVPSDCDTAFCVDGFCCDTACNGVCVACSTAKKADGANGVCGIVPAGTDPHNTCDPQPSSSCGNSSGVCTALGECQKWAPFTPCGDVATCANGVATNPDSCNGAGACVDKGTVSCGLYACGATACKASCADDADCSGGGYCSGGACVAKKATGLACSASNQCQTGFCVDTVCCDKACNGACEACIAALGSPATGTCGPTPANQDLAGDCGAGALCDGSGVCKKLNGEACAAATDCLSGSCADGFCCNTPCTGLCQACSSAKKGGSPDGSCAFIATGTDPENECPGVTVCNAVGTCTLLATGDACAINGECQSGFCADGVCCQTACQGFCQACSAAKTGGTSGTCADITPGTDPDNECPGTQSCAGAFSCTPP